MTNKQNKTQRQKNKEAKIITDKNVAIIKANEENKTQVEVDKDKEEQPKRKGTLREFIGKENEVGDDERFPEFGQEEEEEKKEEEPKDKVNFPKFKKQNEKENRLKKYYDIKNKLKEKLGIKLKLNPEPTVVSGIIFRILQFMDFGVNAFFIILLSAAGYLAIQAIQNDNPLQVVVICLFMIVLSYISDKTKG